MPQYKCPFQDCTYETEDIQDELAAVHLLDWHMHTASAAATGSSKEQSYYVEATKITGKDKVVQLLECCDEHLTRTSHEMLAAH